MFKDEIYIDGRKYRIESEDLETFEIEDSEGTFIIMQTPEGWTSTREMNAKLLTWIGKAVNDQVWFRAHGV